MKTSTNSSTCVTVSRTTGPPSARGRVFLRLVEEPAPLEKLSALFGAHLHVSRGEQEHLVGDALHAAVQRVGEAAREVDQPLRELCVGALQIEDHGDRLFEAVGDLLRVVEAPREYEVDADGVRVLNRLEPRSDGTLPAGGCAGGPLALGGFRPVVEVLRAAARRQPADVRPLAVALLH